MEVSIEEFDGTVSRVTCKLDIDSESGDKVETFNLDRFHPILPYFTVSCSYTSNDSPDEVCRYQVWLCLAHAKLLSMDSEQGSSIHPSCSRHEDVYEQNIEDQPTTVLASINGGEKSVLKLTTPSTFSVSWTSQKFHVSYLSNPTRMASPHNLLPLTCRLWIKFENFSLSQAEKNLIKHMGKLCIQETNYDIQFCFNEGSVIGSHSYILASRSQIFAEMFRHHQQQEYKITLIYVNNVELNIFKQMLHYIYSGRTLTPLTQTVAQPLLLIAEKYKIDDLKEDCTQFLCSCFNNENVIKLLVWAHRHHIDELKKAALIFTTQNCQGICHKGGEGLVDLIKIELGNTRG